MSLCLETIRRVARGSVFLAALLYVFGATAGSALHVHDGEEAESSIASLLPVDASSPDSAPGKTPSHDERSCFFCKTISGPALPTAESGVRFASVRQDLSAAAPAAAVTSFESDSPRARAPPAA